MQKDDWSHALTKSHILLEFKESAPAHVPWLHRFILCRTFISQAMRAGHEEVFRTANYWEVDIRKLENHLSPYDIFLVNIKLLIKCQVYCIYNYITHVVRNDHRWKIINDRIFSALTIDAKSHLAFGFLQCWTCLLCFRVFDPPPGRLKKKQQKGPQNWLCWSDLTVNEAYLISHLKSISKYHLQLFYCTV